MKPIFIGIVVVLSLILLKSALFVVNETELALVVELGKPKRAIKQAGLHLKIPFIENVNYFDKRLMQYDSDPKELLTGDKQQIVVDNYARWKITDPLLFFQSVRTLNGALSRLDDVIYSALREVLGKYTLLDLISTKRSELVMKAKDISNEKAEEIGIKIVDVRIKRADLPEKNERNVFERMITERQRLAKKFRAEGEEEARKIRSLAQKDARIIIAEAKKEAELLRGQGDAASTKIFSQAYNLDPEFFKFTRQLETYKKIFSESTSVIISTDNEMMKAFETGN